MRLSKFTSQLRHNETIYLNMRREKSSRVLMQSFGYGGEEGPTIKIEREEGQENIFPDAGLWANAEEIRKNLELRLDNVLT